MRTTVISVSLAAALMWAVAAKAQTIIGFEKGPCTHHLFYGHIGAGPSGFSDFHLQLDDTTVLVARVVLSPDSRIEAAARHTKTLGCENRNITLAEIRDINSGTLNARFLEPDGKQYPINQLSLIIETDRYFKYVCPGYGLYFDLITQAAPETDISLSGSRLQATYNEAFSMDVGGKDLYGYSWTEFDLDGKSPTAQVYFIPGIGQYRTDSPSDTCVLLMVNGQNVESFLQDFAVGKQKLRGKIPVLPSQETAKPAENPVATNVPNGTDPAVDRPDEKPVQPVSQEQPQKPEPTQKTPPVLLGGQLDPGGYYTVQSGDYLSAIAKQFNVSVETIMGQNRLDGAQLKAGQRLLVRATTGYTPPPTPTPETPAAPPAAANGVHIVQKNETVYTVAEKYGVPIGTLIELNQLNTFDLVPGQQIVYKAGAVKTAPTAQAARLGFHIVQKSETLGSIAERYSTTVQELIEWNRLTDAKNLRIGQELRVQRPNPSAPATGNPTAAEPFPPLPGGSNPTAATGRHTVEKGQNLFRIAQLYGSTVDELKRLNGLEGDAVKIGQQLIVPSRGSAAQPPKEAVKKLPVPVEDDRPEKTAPSQPVYHVVQKGEFLNGIARKHGTSAAALVKLNGLADADQIRPGQKLRVK